MEEEQRKHFIERVNFYKGMGLNPIQAISSAQAELK
jgi:hypothetical protein